MPFLSSGYNRGQSTEEWEDLKHYFNAVDHELMNLPKQANAHDAQPKSMRKSPAVAYQTRVQRPTPYQQLPTKTNKQKNYVDSPRNECTINQERDPQTIDELFNGIQNY